MNRAYIADKETLDKISNSISGLSYGFEIFQEDNVFVVPENVNYIYITACGGGEGGQAKYYDSGYEDYRGGANGNGGQVILQKVFKVSPGQSINISIGLGGDGGKPGQDDSIPARGKAGSPTIIGNLVTVLGGTYTSTFTSYYGNPILSKIVGNSQNGYGTEGGSIGPVGGYNNEGPGIYGSGGKGAIKNNDTGYKGGDGIVIIEWGL